MKLSKDNCVFLFIDQQGKMLPALYETDRLMKTSEILAKVARIYDIPGIITTQYKKGLGDIHPSLQGYGFAEVDKVTFSACPADGFLQALEATGRNKVVVTGAETHICVYQTCRDLLAMDYEVHVLVDGVASRSKLNYKTGLGLIERADGYLNNLECTLFDLLGDSRQAEFKEIQALIK